MHEHLYSTGKNHCAIAVASEAKVMDTYQPYIDGLVQDCSNSIAKALELLQPCSKPSMYS